MQRDDGTPVTVIGYPARLSRTPARYREAPPRLAQHTREVLAGTLGLDEAEIRRLLEAGVIMDASG